ncbi:MAG: 3'-5' exonuclease [Richelia sp. RM2_1_2]|nr:3'-5' exonuclease [Richelia sp. RM2_1_2]
MTDFEVDKLKSVNWAKKLLKGDFGDWVILDTETTGLSHDNEPIEIGIVSKYGSEIFNQRIKPLRHIELGATNIHGIHKKDLESAPTMAEVYPKLKEVLENKLVVIYNDSFDKKSLFNSIKTNSLPRIKFSTVCAMMQYARYYGAWHDYYENYAWQKLPGGDHTAIGDAKATHKLIKMMAAYEAEIPQKSEAMFPPVQVFIEWKFKCRLGLFVSEKESHYKIYPKNIIKRHSEPKYSKGYYEGWFDLDFPVYYPNLVIKESCKELINTYSFPDWINNSLANLKNKLHLHPTQNQPN